MTNNIPILFSIETAEVIPQILAKYNLPDFNEEMLEKIDKGETFIIPGSIILNSTLKVIRKELPLESLPITLQQELKIPAETAKALSKDIEEQLIAKQIAQKIFTDYDNVGAPQRKPIESIEPTKPTVISDDLLKEKEKIAPKEIKNTATIKEKKTGKPDVYREPIE